MAPTIRSFLELSTAYLPERMFDDSTPRPTGWSTIEHGALLWVPDDPDAEDNQIGADAQPEIIAVRRYARSLGCDYVLFDACADTNVAALPTWEW